MKAPPKRVWVVVGTNGPVHVDDRPSEPSLIGPSQTQHEYTLVPKRPAKRKRVKR